MSPVSKLVPSSAVAVWAVLSLLVTVTAAPLAAVSEAGVNLKLLIVSAFELPPEAGDDDAWVDFDGALASLPPPQPAISVAVAETTTSQVVMRREVMPPPS